MIAQRNVVVPGASGKGNFHVQYLVGANTPWQLGVTSSYTDR